MIFWFILIVFSLIKVTVALSLTVLSAFLLRISTVSPIFKLDGSAFSNKVISLALKLSISYLVLKLYCQVLNANSLKFLFLFSIFSPRFLTDINSSFNNKPNLDLSLISDNTPVILKTTFFVVFPYSYPKIVSWDLISSVVLITCVTPEHPKNWFTFLLVYVIVLLPLVKVPIVVNPTVESTVITEDPIETVSVTLVFGDIVKLPWIRLLSSNPANNWIL